VLCGNSIHQDRRFIRRYMPALDARLHYRMVDVSTIKELGRRWYPDEVAVMPAKNDSHRALDDIRESIAELRWYRERLFLPRVRPGGAVSE
jgi:oligoribonuclease